VTPEPEWAPNLGVDGGDPRAQISHLEAHLDELGETLQNCRKYILVARIAMIGGAIWLLAVLLGVVGLDPLGIVAAIAAVIGGTVVFGSNTTTASQISADIREAEARRTALIGSLELRVVGEARPLSER
jgi:hypothetical protein